MNEKEIKTGWKVVRPWINGVYLSAISGYGETEYYRNRWTKRCESWGPLAVFTDLAEARQMEWELLYCQAVLFQCKYVPSEDTALWAGHIRTELAELGEGVALAEKVFLMEWR